MPCNKELILPCVVSAVAAAAATAVVLKGGCCAKPATATTVVAEQPKESDEIYESTKSAMQYCEFHFTAAEDLFTYKPGMTVSAAFNFTERLAQKFEQFKPATPGRALDLGCAVGNSALHMSKSFGEVVGVDLSPVFVEFAERMRTEKVMVYDAPGQGLNGVSRKATLPADLDVSNVRFVVGDALNVDPALGKFDGLLAANLLCRVPEPRRLLDSFAGLLNKGGVLVIASPYSWWEGATASEKWIGGHKGDAKSEELAKAILARDFELLDEQDEPFLIRDHVRRFQLGFSHCTVWRRK